MKRKSRGSLEIRRVRKQSPLNKKLKRSNSCSDMSKSMSTSMSTSDNSSLMDTSSSMDTTSTHFTTNSPRDTEMDHPLTYHNCDHQKTLELLDNLNEQMTSHFQLYKSFQNLWNNLKSFVYGM